MATTQLNGSTQIKSGTITDTQISVSAAIATTKLAEGSLFLKKDGSITATGNFDQGGFKITELGNPTAAQDAATKAYVDGAIQGLDIKESVKLTTTENITLSGTQTIDGVGLSINDRILVKNQSTASENGIYVVQSGTWIRAADAVNGTVTTGLFTFVEQGTLNAGTGWVLTTSGTITVGTTPLTFTQFSGATTVASGNNSITINGIAVSVNIEGDTLAIGTGLKVADGGITESQINSSSISTTGGLAGGLADGSATKLAVKLDNDNSLLTTTSSGLKIDVSRIVKREIPSGTINGSNRVFTLAHTPIIGKEDVILNGSILDSGSGNDYTISGSTITFEAGFAPLDGDKIRVSYIY